MADQKSMKAVVRGNNKFTNAIYQQLKNEAGNIIMSPITLYASLGILHQGAEEETLQAISKVLNIEEKKTSAQGFRKITNLLNNLDGVVLKVANGMYIGNDYKLKPSYKDSIANQFSANIENIDFAGEDAAKKMNDWIAEKTENKINNIISPEDLDKGMQAMVLNAIYFKGKWAKIFKEKRTTKEHFYTSLNDFVEVDMMNTQTEYYYKLISKLDAQVVKLPYKNNKLSMLILLPKQRCGIGNLEEKLATFDLSELSKSMRMKEVKLALPRFKFETGISLNQHLEKLGLENIFSSNANFSGVFSNSSPLQVNNVMQMAFIEVNEEGSEAAAMNANVTYALGSESVGPISVRADHPFMFFICYDDIILCRTKSLIGTLMKPRMN